MALLDGRFYRPTRTIYGDPAEHDLAHDKLWFSAADGTRLSGWWFPAESARGTVVHCHGNGGNISGHYDQVAWLPASGYNVLCFDYRGYGASEGHPSREGTISDALAAVEVAAERSGHGGRILLFGQSLGGAIAVVVAARRHDLAGVVVDGGFNDYQAEVRWILKRVYWGRWIARFVSRRLISRGADPMDCVHQVSPTPLFLMHGTEDRVCPWTMSQELHDRAGEPKELWLIPGADHYEALDKMPDIARPRLLEFFAFALGRIDQLAG